MKKFIALPIIFDITENREEIMKEAKLCNKEYVPELEESFIKVNTSCIESYNEGINKERTVIGLTSGKMLNIPLNVENFEKKLNDEG